MEACSACDFSCRQMKSSNRIFFIRPQKFATILKPREAWRWKVLIFFRSTVDSREGNFPSFYSSHDETSSKAANTHTRGRIKKIMRHTEKIKFGCRSFMEMRQAIILAILFLLPSSCFGMLRQGFLSQTALEVASPRLVACDFSHLSLWWREISIFLIFSLPRKYWFS